MTTTRYAPIIDALLGMTDFRDELYDRLMAFPGTDVLEYFLHRVGPDTILKLLTNESVVNYVFDNCADELRDYMKENVTAEADMDTLSW